MKELPPALKPYMAHGIEINWKEGNGHVVSECFLCGKVKWHCNTENGLWDCKVCGEKGNVYTFFRKLWSETEIDESAEKQLKELAKERGLQVNTLKRWGVKVSPITGEIIVPGYSAKGEIIQLYRYASPKTGDKKVLQVTAETNHALFGVNRYKETKGLVFLCEGPWDAMAMEEMLKKHKFGDNRIEETGSIESSIYASVNVLGVPGANVWKKDWAKLLADKEVTLWYHNDHPITVKNKKVDGAGLAGMKRVVQTLTQSEEKPAVLNVVKWGTDWYDPGLKTGYDVRDMYREYEKKSDALEKLIDLAVPVPSEWVPGRDGNSEAGKTQMDCVPCTSYKTLTNAWKSALKWTDGLDRALSTMLACIASTNSVGEQLWARIVGPPSCGKSTLCEAVAVNHKYVIAKSTIRGFYSGWKVDGAGAEDSSLISKLKGKTLITKDGDTLLQSPNLGQILSEARDLYDGVGRTDYRNRMGRDYVGIRVTWILCGTESLVYLDNSELGERFLTCVIMQGIDPTLEEDILMRVAHRTNRSMGIESNANIETHYEPAMIKAMQLTGGYIDFIRTDTTTKLDKIVFPDAELEQCTNLGKFVAFMRARPGTKSKGQAGREMGARLVAQIVRLAKCTALVLNKPIVDEEVMRRVTCVAKDTARGRTLELCKIMACAGEDGAECSEMAVLTGHDEKEELDYLRFLRRLGAAERLMRLVPPSRTHRPHYRLSQDFMQLYVKVMGEPELPEPSIEEQDDDPNN